MRLCQHHCRTTWIKHPLEVGPCLCHGCFIIIHSYEQQKVLLPVARSGEVPPVWWVPAPVTGISQPPASSHRQRTGDPPRSFIYALHPAGGRKHKTVASRPVAQGVLFGAARVPLHALITVQTEPIPLYPTCPRAPQCL